MKKHLLFVLIMLLLQSCAWTYRLNPLVGDRFEVENVNTVVFYEGPSLNSASFHLEKPEGFTIITPTCPEGKFSCNMQMLKDPYSGFFKVRFDSGKEAYISYKDFYSRFAMTQNYKTSPPPPAPKDSMICDPLPYKKGSFRCRME